MSVTITTALVKQMLLPELAGVSDDDAVISEIIDNVTAQVVSYFDDSMITGRATIPSDCEWPMMKQIAYEYRRRKDPGLSSVSFPDGTVNKFSDGEFIEGFTEVLDRTRKIHIGG